MGGGFERVACSGFGERRLPSRGCSATLKWPPCWKRSELEIEIEIDLYPNEIAEGRFTSGGALLHERWGVEQSCSLGLLFMRRLQGGLSSWPPVQEIESQVEGSHHSLQDEAGIPFSFLFQGHLLTAPSDGEPVLFDCRHFGLAVIVGMNIEAVRAVTGSLATTSQVAQGFEDVPFSSEVGLDPM